MVSHCGILDVLDGLSGKERSCLFDSTVVKVTTHESEVLTAARVEEIMLEVTERAMVQRTLEYLFTNISAMKLSVK